MFKIFIITIIFAVCNVDSRRGLLSDYVMKKALKMMQMDPDATRSLDSVLFYRITVNDRVVRTWTMDLRNILLYPGPPKVKPDVTITVSDENCFLLATGRLDPMTAFLDGLVEVSGDFEKAKELYKLITLR